MIIFTLWICELKRKLWSPKIKDPLSFWQESLNTSQPCDSEVVMEVWQSPGWCVNTVNTISFEVAFVFVPHWLHHISPLFACRVRDFARFYQRIDFGSVPDSVVSPQGLNYLDMTSLITRPALWVILQKTVLQLESLFNLPVPSDFFFYSLYYNTIMFHFF